MASIKPQFPFLLFRVNADERYMGVYADTGGIEIGDLVRLISHMGLDYINKYHNAWDVEVHIGSAVRVLSFQYETQTWE